MPSESAPELRHTPKPSVQLGFPFSFMPIDAAAADLAFGVPLEAQLRSALHQCLRLCLVQGIGHNIVFD